MEDILHNDEIVVYYEIVTAMCHVCVFRQIGIAHVMQTSGQREFFSLGMILK